MFFIENRSLEQALAQAGTPFLNLGFFVLLPVEIPLRAVGGLIAIPSLAHPHFMEAHYLATQVILFAFFFFFYSIDRKKIGLLPRKDVVVRTIDTGGAGPISGLLEAARMIKMEWYFAFPPSLSIFLDLCSVSLVLNGLRCEVVAVVAGDAISSLPKDEFLRRADRTCQNPAGDLPRFSLSLSLICMSYRLTFAVR